jgi:hypothetical protein
MDRKLLVLWLPALAVFWFGDAVRLQNYSRH